MESGKLAISLLILIFFSGLPVRAKPEIEFDRYNGKIKATTRLSDCSLAGKFAKEYEIMVSLDSCYFTAISKPGAKTAWIEFLTNNKSWIEMSHSIKTAGIFLTSGGRAKRLTLPARWDGSAVSGGVLESIVIDIAPGSAAWTMLKKATLLEAKFNNLEYRVSLSAEDAADINESMRKIFE